VTHEGCVFKAACVVVYARHLPHREDLKILKSSAKNPATTVDASEILQSPPPPFGWCTLTLNKKWDKKLPTSTWFTSSLAGISVMTHQQVSVDLTNPILYTPVN